MAAARELDGLRALVTGGTQGIGASVVARLREAGAQGPPTPAPSSARSSPS